MASQVPEFEPAIAPIYNKQWVPVDTEKGLGATVHWVRYPREAFTARVFNITPEVPLLEWSRANNYPHAINGGFFLRATGQPLGDMRVDGKTVDHVPFGNGWNTLRGSLGVDHDDELTIGPRHTLPPTATHILSAGPTLLQNRRSTFLDDPDPEGFSETAYQHDDPVNAKRHPRAAIGVCKRFIHALAIDGRSKHNSGMFLQETAAFMRRLGIIDAFNLDGGSTASLVYEGDLKNNPRRLGEPPSIPGYPTRSCIAFVLRQSLSNS